MPDVITKVVVNDTRSIRADIPLVGGETLEYKFSTKFRVDREIAAGDKDILVLVLFAGNEIGRFPVEVTLTKPGASAPFLVQEQNNLPDSSLPTVPLPPEIEPLPGFLFAANPPGASGTVPGDPTPPPPPPIRDRLIHTIANDDPNGEWRITIRNVGFQTATFRILIAHPGMQLPLSNSKIPLTLVNRMLDKIRRLVNLKATIGRKARFDFSEEFKRLTGLTPREVDVNKITDLSLFAIGPETFPGNDVFLRDIKLNELSLVVTERASGSVFNAHLGFETGGAAEIVINNSPDVNLTKLTFDVEAVLSNTGSSAVVSPNRSLVFTEHRDFLGQVTEQFAGQVSFAIDVKHDVRANIFQGKIDDAVDSAIRVALHKPETRQTLSTLAEHLTDHLMFLATGDPDRLFFNVGADSSSVVVTHYPKPSVKLLIQEPGIVDEQVVAPVENTGTAGLTFTTTLSPSSAIFFPGPAPQPGPVAPAGPSRAGEPGNGSTKKIDHLVVLMLENRSFDHMLGYLSLEKGRTDIEGLRGPTFNTNPVPGSVVPQPIHELDTTIVATDPSHNHVATKEQIADGGMTGFVSNYMKKTRPGDEGIVMGFYTHRDLNVFDFLAENYTVCDRWFCAHPGPTYPNRFISLMGSTSNLENIDLGGTEAGATKGDTIFDILSKVGINWKYVESNIAFLRMFDKYRVDDENIIQRKRPSGRGNFISGDTFLELAESGRLPAVTWIDPNFGELELDGDANDDHPPADVLKGQELVCEIYRALTKAPNQWRRTLFVILYDEHGGFYDHVPPHGLNDITSPQVHPVHPEGPTFYGPRVPALLISPWVGAKTASHVVFDHTSLLKTILLNFIGPDAATTEALGKRVDAANDLMSELLDEVRSDIPDCPEPRAAGVAAAGSLPKEKFDPQSFHMSMRLFPFGFKLKSLRPN
jgi:phospholipase C